MRDPNDPAEAPEAPEPVEELADGLQTAQQVAGVVQSAAETIQGLAEGGPSEDVTPAGVLGGLAGAAGGAAQGATALGADPAVSQALGVASQASALAGALYEAGEAIVEAVEAIIGGDDAHIVRYAFKTDADPENYEGHWLVRSVEWTERLGEPYRAHIDLLNEDLDARAEDLVGSKCTLTLTRGPITRQLHGIVDRLETGHATNRYIATSVELVPALACLAQRFDSRVFQEKTVEDIIQEVLAPLELLGREVELVLSRDEPYPLREYCTQYEETDLAFLHRLLESEGLTYYFDQTGEDAEKLIVTDHSAFDAVTTMDGEEVVPFVPTEQEVATAEPLRDLVRGKRATSTSIVIAEHDWTQGVLEGVNILEETRQTDEHDRDREVYVAENPLTLHEYSGGSFGAHDMAAQKRLRRELLVRDAITVRGRGVVTNFAPGFRFDVHGNPSANLDGRYYLVQVRHRGISFEHRDAVSEGQSGTDANYSNAFTCLPIDVPYRPDRSTPKPRIAGILSATVVGPEGQEFWTDEHRRVKAQFHWDRLGQNEGSSCFLRVQQTWAGSGYGFSFLPRIGMEVLVAFIGGDPDRPVVTGCIHNGYNAPPYTENADMPRSTIKTCSTDRESHGGARYNELSFYDEKEQEEISLRAQKDLREDVLHDHSTHVHRHQSLSVDADQTETVGGDQTTTVHGERRAKVEKNEHVDILKGQTVHVGADHSLTVDQNQRLVTDGERHVFVNKKDNESYNAGRETIVKAGDTLDVQDGHRIVRVDNEHNTTAGDHISMKVGAGDSSILMTTEVRALAKDRATVAVGGSKVEVTPDVVELAATSEIRLVVGATSYVLKSSGKAELTAPAGIKLQCGANTIEASPSGVTINGVKLTMAATAMCEISGGVVCIN